jgi:cell division protein FtsI (penicillin-binding protein 3)
MALLVAFQLVRVVFLDGSTLTAQAAQRYTKTVVSYAKRGTIYDINHRVLAYSEDCSDIYADCTQISNPAATAQELSSVLGGKSTDYLILLTKNPSSTFVYIKKQVETKQVQALQQRQAVLKQQYINGLSDKAEAPLDPPTALRGINYLKSTKRCYPYGKVAAQIVGSVQQVDGSSGTQLVGKSGIELAYNADLTGVDGQTVAQTAKNGVPLPGGVISQSEAQDGNDLVLSIDIDLQKYVEQRLAAVAHTYGRDQGTVTVEDGATGEIYAAASLPLYKRGKLTQKAVEAGATNLKQITATYEPGSVFKGMTFAVALSKGVIDPTTMIHCPAHLKVDGYTISDSHLRPAEDMSATQIIARSSNIGTSLIKKRITNKDFYDALQSFGIGQATHVDYPGEALGQLAAPKTWSDVQADNISFGQGVSVTPLQVLAYYSALANKGTKVEPHFLINESSDSKARSYPSSQILAPETVSELTPMLQQVVKSGTGVNARISGFKPAGKTGTAQIASPSGGYQAHNYNVSFVGFLPGSSSSLTCMCTMDKQPSTEVVNPTPILFKQVMAYAIKHYDISPG